MNRLNRYNKIKADQSLAILETLENLEKIASEKAEKISKDILQSALKNFLDGLTPIIKETLEQNNNIQDIIEENNEKLLQEIKSNNKIEVTEDEKEEDNELINQQNIEIEDLKLKYNDILSKLETKSDKFDKSSFTKDILDQIMSKVMIKFEEIETIKGEPGTTPIAGVDYPSKEEFSTMISNMAQEMINSKTKEIGEKIKIKSTEEIVKEIESLPENKKLDYYKGIKNTPSDNTSINRNTITKGGGMGNWEHEAFSTSSATTTVTLSRKVAANSTAILVRYNGQLLAHGVQYTISGRIISFTFTLDDSSTVDVTYVRA